MIVVALGWYLLRLLADPEIKEGGAVPASPVGCDLDENMTCTT